MAIFLQKYIPLSEIPDDTIVEYEIKETLFGKTKYITKECTAKELKEIVLNQARGALWDEDGKLVYRFS